MELTKAAVGWIAAGCVAAGAAGAYVATRPGVPASDATLAAPGPEQGVEQSESVIEDAPEAPDAAAAPAPPDAAPPAHVPPRAEPRIPKARPAATASPAFPAQQPPVASTEVVPIAPAPIEPATPVEIAPPPAAAPATPELQELVVSTESVIGLQIESALSSESARLEDPVMARVSRDVKVGDQVVIPAGAKAQGEVTLVERGGKIRERARLGVRFTSIVLADGTRLPISTEPIYREGDAPGRESATKIGGGAIGGAIIGGIFGGAKGAAIGGSIGAGAGSAAVLAGGRNAATLPAGSPVTVRLQEPATVVVPR